MVAPMRMFDEAPTTSKRWRTWGTGTLLALMLGCGGKATTSPEAALQVLLDAAHSGDPTAFRAGFPSREEIGELFSCPSGVDLIARFDGLSDDFTAWRDARPTVAAFQAYQAVPVVTGEDIGGCSARRAMNLVRADVRLTEAAKSKDYSMRFVEIDGRYRVLGY